MLQVIPTAKKLLLTLTLLLTVSCSTWQNRPHVGDYENEKIIFEGEFSANEVHCSEPDFNAYICFHHSEIADLISLLEKYGIEREEATKIKKLLNFRDDFIQHQGD